MPREHHVLKSEDSRLNPTSSAMAPKLIIRSILRILVLLSIGLGGFLMGRYYYNVKLPTSPVITMLHQHAKSPSPIIHQRGGLLDNCPMLMDCFPDPDSIYRDMDSCHSNMNYILKYYDSSIILVDGKSVGFISFHMEEDPDNPDHKAINIYNVCIDKKYRGKGLAKKMTEEGVEEMIRHHKLKGKKTLLALDVNFKDKMAAEAFSMYVKLGYFRAWQPCHGIGDIDWRPLFNTPKADLVKSPLSTILSDPETYKKEEIIGNKLLPHLQSRRKTRNEPMFHYCMFKFYGESWHSLGQTLNAPIKEMLAKSEAE